MVSKTTICLWYDGTALDAAIFYANTFPDSVVGAVHRAPGDYPAGKHSETFSFQIATEDQAETDPDPAVAKRAFNAMMQMTKIDIAATRLTNQGAS